MKIVDTAHLTPEGEFIHLESFSDALGLLREGELEKRFCVAVSGGADSLALALLMKDYSDTVAGEIHTVTVDHGLRDESSQEAEQVKTWMKERSIPHTILKWETPPSSPPHEVSRSARYELLLKWCRENKVGTLLTAHHKDDQAETVLMRFMSGSGVDGLSGIAPKVKAGDVTILRPLLGESKEGLMAYLSSQGQPWIEDPSNQSDAYKRSRIRGFMAKEGLEADRLQKVSQKMVRVRDYFGGEVKTWMERDAELNPAGFYLLQREPFLKLHPEMQTRVLIKGLCAIGGKVYPPRSEDVSHLLGHLREKTSSKTLHGCVVSLWKGKLLISREEVRIEGEEPLKPGGTTIWDNRFDISIKEEGYSISKLSLENWSEIRKKIDEKEVGHIPAVVKPTLPAIYKQNQLVACPLLGYNPGDMKVDLTFFETSDLFNPIFTIA